MTTSTHLTQGDWVLHLSKTAEAVLKIYPPSSDPGVPLEISEPAAIKRAIDQEAQNRKGKAFIALDMDAGLFLPRQQYMDFSERFLSDNHARPSNALKNLLAACGLDDSSKHWIKKKPWQPHRDAEEENRRREAELRDTLRALSPPRRGAHGRFC